MPQIDFDGIAANLVEGVGLSKETGDCLTLDIATALRSVAEQAAAKANASAERWEAEAVGMGRSVKLLHKWAHSGSRENDHAFQVKQLGRDICETIVERATELEAEVIAANAMADKAEAEVARLKAQHEQAFNEAADRVLSDLRARRDVLRADKASEQGARLKAEEDTEFKEELLSAAYVENDHLRGLISRAGEAFDFAWKRFDSAGWGEIYGAKLKECDDAHAEYIAYRDALAPESDAEKQIRGAEETREARKMEPRWDWQAERDALAAQGLGFASVDCPHCRGLGKMDVYDPSKSRKKFFTAYCRSCHGTGKQAAQQGEK